MMIGTGPLPGYVGELSRQRRGGRSSAPGKTKIHDRGPTMTPRPQESIGYYDILGVAPTASIEEIKAAYRARINAHHPDRDRSPHATAIAALLNDAWEVLRDVKRRARYDAQMRFSGTQPAYEAPVASPARRGQDERARPRTATDREPLTSQTFHIPIRRMRSRVRWVAGLAAVGGAIATTVYFANSDARVRSASGVPTSVPPQPFAVPSGPTIQQGRQSQLEPRAHTDRIPAVAAIAKRDAYNFALALVDGMWVCIDAEHSIQRSRGSNEPAVDVADNVSLNRSAQAAWSFAQRLVSPYGTSQDVTIAGVARALATSYGDMADLYGRRVRLLEVVPRDQATNITEPTSELSQIDSESNQVVRSMMVSTAAAGQALVDLTRHDKAGHDSYLKLTRSQVTEIANRLNSLAGSSPGSTSTDDSPQTAQVPAVIFWRWIGKSWHASDEQ